MPEPTLAEAVDKAKNEIIEESKKAGIDPVADAPLTEEEEDDEIPDSDDEPEGENAAALDELDAPSLDEAKRLYKALKDPVAGPAVLAALAQQAGLLGKNAPETKAETKAAQRAITEILSEALGKDYAFLTDKLGPAIEAVFEQQQASLEEKFNKIEADKVESQVIVATRELNRLTKGESGKLEARMAELSNEMPPAPGISVDKYLKHLFVLAGGKLPTGTNGKSNAERIQRNANDTADRLQGKGTSSRGSESALPDKKLSLDEAIKVSQEQIKKGKHSW